MRRADRLFQVVQLLRARRGGIVTARQIAERLEVSLRTVYRDVADLIGSGVPIEGEAGVGYCLQKGFDLPPLMFDRSEIGALVLGARMVRAFADRGMAAHAESLLAKIEQVVPPKLLESFAQPELAVPPTLCPEVRAGIERVRTAIDQHKKLRVGYTDFEGAVTTRTLRPLCLAFWGMVWTAGCWCELRRDYRTFRVDRMDPLAVLDDTFADEPDASLAGYLGSLGQQLREDRGWRDDWRARNA
ncbi:MAG: helix-turn-helix transcriptional regulator [Planctomycetota bacterium]